MSRVLPYLARVEDGLTSQTPWRATTARHMTRIHDADSGAAADDYGTGTWGWEGACSGWRAIGAGAAWRAARRGRRGAGAVRFLSRVPPGRHTRLGPAGGLQPRHRLEPAAWPAAPLRADIRFRAAPAAVLPPARARHPHLRLRHRRRARAGGALRRPHLRGAAAGRAAQARRWTRSLGRTDLHRRTNHAGEHTLGLQLRPARLRRRALPLGGLALHRERRAPLAAGRSRAGGAGRLQRLCGRRVDRLRRADRAAPWLA